MTIESGRVIAGKYRIERELGKGGMGAVYAAQHVFTQKRVALKIMLPTATGFSEGAIRFTREAQAAGRIHHPNVVDVYDIGEHDGAPFIVMELLVGRSLADLVRQRKLTAPEALSIMIPAMRGIAAAHEAGVIHRDLKPENIFVCGTADGWRDVKVLDFGISKVSEIDGMSTDGLTRTGTVMGTPHYMAPEQIRASRDVEPRTDVYALGVILYRMLTGQLPFKGESYGALAISIATEAPVSMRQFVPDVDPQLEAVIFRGMARDLWSRYADVASFARALEPWANGVTFDVTNNALPSFSASIRPSREIQRPSAPGKRPTTTPTEAFDPRRPSRLSQEEVAVERADGTVSERRNLSHSSANPTTNGRLHSERRSGSNRYSDSQGGIADIPIHESQGTFDPQISWHQDALPRRKRWIPAIAGVVVLAAIAIGASTMSFEGETQDAARADSIHGQAGRPIQEGPESPSPAGEASASAEAANSPDALHPPNVGSADAGAPTVSAESANSINDPSQEASATRRRATTRATSAPNVSNEASSQRLPETQASRTEDRAPVVESNGAPPQTSRRAGDLSVEDF